MRCRTQKLKEITTVHGTDIIQIKEELTALQQQLTNEDVMSTNDTSSLQTANQSFITTDCLVNNNANSIIIIFVNKFTEDEGIAVEIARLV